MLFDLVFVCHATRDKDDPHGAGANLIEFLHEVCVTYGRHGLFNQIEI